jgi:hypothetical protein
MSIIAGVIIVISSLLFTNVVFPEYFEELEASYRTMLAGQGQSEAEIAAEVQAWSAAQTPMNQAMNGFIGTFVTGVVVSAVAALWIRARPR